jgi:hypothetical protein
MEDNVVNFSEALTSRGHGEPCTSKSAIPSADPDGLEPASPSEATPLGNQPREHPAEAGHQRARLVVSKRLDRPASEPSTQVAVRRLTLPASWRKSAGTPPGGVLARRARRRALRRRRAHAAGGWLRQRGWWVLRGLGIAARSVWRMVWQPDIHEYIQAMAATNPVRARTARKELRQERLIGTGVVVGLGVLGYITLQIWGAAVLQWLPWWAYPVAATVVLTALAAAGRPAITVERPIERENAQMPMGLDLAASDRGVIATLSEAFADTKIRATVDHVRREPGGWGWMATLSILDGITEPKLEALERYLNTPVGGLVFSDESRAARVRYLRIVMADLLAQPISAPDRTPTSVRIPTELATRFDGGRLQLELFARHVLIIGRTGSGKSGVLHDILDALTSTFDATVDGLDIAGGPDLRSWEKALRNYVGGPDYVKAEALLADAVALVKDRTARLGTRNWDPAQDGAGHAVVIDEYGMVAEHSRLRSLVEYIVTYGAKAGVWVILANQRKVRDMMGSSTVASQVHIKIYLGMDAEDVQALPKALREQGVRPHLFQQATRTDPNDAGKAFVLGVESLPILCRFDRTDRITAERRAIARAPHRPDLSERDRQVIRRAETGGVPDLLLSVREAVLATASAAGRNPERASGEEICVYLGQRGRAIDKTALVKELRKVSGGLINRSRDTNLAPRSNPKGFYLEDLDRAIATLRERAWQSTHVQNGTGTND